VSSQTVKRAAASMLAGSLLAGAAAAPAEAHHAYAQYDRCNKVSIEGSVESVAWENPHVVIKLATSGDTVYRIEWQNLNQLAQSGIRSQVLEPGDRLVVTGSTNKNPAIKIMTLLSEIRRTSDGWSWQDRRPAARAACQD
jgi:hypothetical protein